MGPKRKMFWLKQVFWIVLNSRIFSTSLHSSHSSLFWLPPKFNFTNFTNLLEILTRFVFTNFFCGFDSWNGGNFFTIDLRRIHEFLRRFHLTSKMYELFFTFFLTRNEFTIFSWHWIWSLFTTRCFFFEFRNSVGQSLTGVWRQAQKWNPCHNKLNFSARFCFTV